MAGFVVGFLHLGPRAFLSVIWVGIPRVDYVGVFANRLRLEH